jgi:fatty-acyl-CoA synthase
MCVNAVLRAGGTLALARRFSARRFWDDVVEMGATAFQYVGELPRYLLDQPAHPLEQRHRIRFCVGNGMRPEVWERFRSRFGIPHVVEFYGATESNVSMVNLEDRVGSVGKPPFGLRVAILRYDVESQDLVRDAAGRLVACREGETGELIGRISEGRTVAGRFEGYTSDAATQSKILRDVFRRGDAWFRSGDLMRRDAAGWFFFVDRIGDTFRWKGENVSTQQVADAIGELPGVELCAVYGVKLPGADGRAGMAALVLRDGCALDGAALYAHVAQRLPGYARPAFVRVLAAADLTGTFKIRKGPLQRDGFEPATASDPVLFRDDARRAYLPLTHAIRERIRSGDVRF